MLWLIKVQKPYTYECLYQHEYASPMNREKIDMQGVQMNFGMKELIKERTEDKIDLEYEGNSKVNVDSNQLTDSQASRHSSTSININK